MDELQQLSKLVRESHFLQLGALKEVLILLRENKKILKNLLKAFEAGSMMLLKTDECSTCGGDLRYTGTGVACKVCGTEEDFSDE